MTANANAHQNGISSFCLPLNTPDPSLSTVGGKALNLARLTCAGFPVPTGFILTTDGYNHHIDKAGLTGWMAAEASAIDAADPVALSALSDRLRARLRTEDIPEEVAAQIRSAYTGLGRPPAAVRSSATAEDLPGMSFAGQQDTFLNVVGDEALLRAVVECWSSLWTARAIAYRTRNNIDHAAVSLAVVVQEMVQSETSGVLFTANPLTGRRDETVIDATFGLGEALVSGQVEPDHYVVETDSGKILRKQLGAKATVVRGLAGGGVEETEDERRSEQALSDEQIARLTESGQRVADLYGDPQDIEWAFAEDNLFILQSRPITSLFPLPKPVDDADLNVFISLGAIQGVLGPFTPLGMDLLRGLFAGIAQIFSFKATLYEQSILHSAADRPWIAVAGALRNPIGRLIFHRVLPMVEPGAAQSIRELISDTRLEQSPFNPRSFARAAPLLSRVLKSAFRAFLDPELFAQATSDAAEAHIASVDSRAHNARTLDQRIDLCEWLCYNALFPVLLPLFIPPIIVGYASLGILSRLAAILAPLRSDISPQLALDLTRSLPNNVTTEMDLELWQVAKRIGEDPAASAAFVAADPEALALEYHKKEMPVHIQAALTAFLNRYGMRGLAELDLGRPRWREQPLPIIRALQSYLSIADESAAPDTVFQQGQQAALQAEDRLANAAAETLNSPLAGWLVRRLSIRVRALAGLRESPKFTLIRIASIARSLLLESGRELVDNGVLEQADDLFFLTMRELKTLAMNAPGDWQRLVRARRETYRNEMRRQPIPRLLLSDGTAFFAGLSPGEGADENMLVGSGVSPGFVEGTVRVVFDPLEAALQPGDILVCPGTDPSWTPLFLAAGGLVMEVGGMMTHGSVVAREYGIPAVAGVDRATDRLKTGQKVRVDGGSGKIELLD